MLSSVVLQSSGRRSPCPTLWFGIALPFPRVLLPPLWEVKWVLAGWAWATYTMLGMLFPLLSTRPQPVKSWRVQEILGRSCTLGKSLVILSESRGGALAPADTGSVSPCVREVFQEQVWGLLWDQIGSPGNSCQQGVGEGSLSVGPGSPCSKIEFSHSWWCKECKCYCLPVVTRWS